MTESLNRAVHEIQKYVERTCRINDLESCEGVIKGVLIGQMGPEFRVFYWHEGERRDAWLFESEITIKY